MAGYVGNVPVPQSVREDQSFTATAGQTTFNTLGYTDGNRIKVTLNGVLLEGGGVDYTATNGSDVVLTVAAAVDDIVRFETFNEFNLVGQNLTTPTFKTSLTMKNDTEEDTDGGRESTVIFSGEQSGGEITTLAEIEASHDGTADDQKGDLIFRTNDGNDGTSPTERLRINSGGDMLFSSEDPSLTLANTTHEDSDGGRESTIVFQGEQSGGEVSTLAQIEAAHDGTADDEKGDLIFRTNDGSDGASPTEAAKIDSAQRFGIKTTNPAARLHVAESSSGLTARFSNESNQTLDIGTVSGSGASGSVYIDNANSGNIILRSGGNERVRMLAAGGLTFNGDTAAANALDDYEEGTWTASLDGITIASQVCRYIKVGTLVHVGAQIAIPITGSGNNAMVGGFPFTVANTDAARAGVVVSWHNTSSSNGLQFLLTNNGTNGFFYLSNSIKSYANMSGVTVYFGGTYIAA